MKVKAYEVVCEPTAGNLVRQVQLLDPERLAAIRRPERTRPSWVGPVRGQVRRRL